jgi:hypothetical protein
MKEIANEAHDTQNGPTKEKLLYHHNCVIPLVGHNKFACRTRGPGLCFRLNIEQRTDGREELMLEEGVGSEGGGMVPNSVLF